MDVKDLYELKEMLIDELKEYGRKGELSTGSLEVVDKLAHASKNIGKVIEMCEESEGYSSRGNYAYGDGRMMPSMSYARGRNVNMRRDNMGRYSSTGYSRANELVSELRNLMEDTPDEKTRHEFERFIMKIENM